MKNFELFYDLLNCYYSRRKEGPHKTKFSINEKVGAAILVGIKEFIKAKLGGKFAITNF